MGEYKSKPVIIDAIQYNGTPDSMEKVIEWLKTYDAKSVNWKYWEDHNQLQVITTSNNSLVVKEGYWIIKEQPGFSGFYTCNPIVFSQKYEEL